MEPRVQHLWNNNNNNNQNVNSLYLATRSLYATLADSRWIDKRKQRAKRKKKIQNPTTRTNQTPIQMFIDLAAKATLSISQASLQKLEINHTNINLPLRCSSNFNSFHSLPTHISLLWKLCWNENVDAEHVAHLHMRPKRWKNSPWKEFFFYTK